ncbi:MAG: hypothetical protein U0V48_14990 [Anaerolineales bacterium]
MRHTHGSIEAGCGSMFSGKTDELIAVSSATIAKQKVQVLSLLLTSATRWKK